MAANIAIPKLGMSMIDATVIEWKVKEGGHVEKGEVVLTIETEKTKWDIEASADGFVHILVSEDVKAPVGRVVGLIAETKEELATLQKEPSREIFTTEVEPAQAPAPETTPAVAKSEERIRISPVARKMAEEHMINVTKVVGTGPNGRIIREDIERAIEAKKKEPVAQAPAATPTTAVYEGKKVKTTIPLKGMRRAIAEHMHRSLSISAQLTLMGEIDMSDVVKLRNVLIEQEPKLGVHITYTDILVLAIARVIKDNPIINSSFIENEIKVWDDINIGVAVALEQGMEGGLIVPVIKNADKKSLVEISREAKTLVDKARVGKLMPDDVSGGTFTLTNLGAFGGGWSVGTPIINQPQSAILGIGVISDRAVVRQGQIVIRPVMTYSFTFDHRVIDGAPASKFMAQLTQALENPGLLFIIY
jgi:pyruvate dehydrogenase E2 component (dihydrolipoamide acetyltransferase)/2-oxoglutarate dehydrogenase E2 component (dihydrolipoamide succinyltransferase)